MPSSHIQSCQSFLHNRLGGLQVLPPGSDKWLYVKVSGALPHIAHTLTDLVQPLPGHGICNVGDALNIFSGGTLRSNIHRVMSAHLPSSSSCTKSLIAVCAYSPPPKDQAQYERWSLVYFTRPHDTVVLRHQGEKSAMIADAVAKAPAGKFDTGVTAGEWLARRIRGTRTTQFKVRRRYRFRRDHELMRL